MQTYFLFCLLHESSLTFPTSKSLSSQGWVLECGLATHRQRTLVTLSFPKLFNWASKEYIAAVMCLQPPSRAPLHLQNASTTLPLLQSFPSKIKWCFPSSVSDRMLGLRHLHLSVIRFLTTQHTQFQITGSLRRISRQ